MTAMGPTLSCCADLAFARQGGFFCEYCGHPLVLKQFNADHADAHGPTLTFGALAGERVWIEIGETSARGVWAPSSTSWRVDAPGGPEVGVDFFVHDGCLRVRLSVGGSSTRIHRVAGLVCVDRMPVLYEIMRNEVDPGFSVITNGRARVYRIKHKKKEYLPHLTLRRLDPNVPKIPLDKVFRKVGNDWHSYPFDNGEAVLSDLPDNGHIELYERQVESEAPTLRLDITPSPVEIIEPVIAINTVGRVEFKCRLKHTAGDRGKIVVIEVGLASDSSRVFKFEQMLEVSQAHESAETLVRRGWDLGDEFTENPPKKVPIFLSIKESDARVEIADAIVLTPLRIKANILGFDLGTSRTAAAYSGLQIEAWDFPSRLWVDKETVSDPQMLDLYKVADVDGAVPTQFELDRTGHVRFAPGASRANSITALKTSLFENTVQAPVAGRGHRVLKPGEVLISGVRSLLEQVLSGDGCLQRTVRRRIKKSGELTEVDGGSASVGGVSIDTVDQPEEIYFTHPVSWTREKVVQYLGWIRDAASQVLVSCTTVDLSGVVDVSPDEAQLVLRDLRPLNTGEPTEAHLLVDLGGGTLDVALFLRKPAENVLVALGGEVECGGDAVCSSIRESLENALKPWVDGLVRGKVLRAQDAASLRDGVMEDAINQDGRVWELARLLSRDTYLNYRKQPGQRKKLLAVAEALQFRVMGGGRHVFLRIREAFGLSEESLLSWFDEAVAVDGDEVSCLADVRKKWLRVIEGVANSKSAEGLPLAVTFSGGAAKLKFFRDAVLAKLRNRLLRVSTDSEGTKGKEALCLNLAKSIQARPVDFGQVFLSPVSIVSRKSERFALAPIKTLRAGEQVCPRRLRELDDRVALIDGPTDSSVINSRVLIVLNTRYAEFWNDSDRADVVFELDRDLRRNILSEPSNWKIYVCRGCFGCCEKEPIPWVLFASIGPAERLTLMSAKEWIDGGMCGDAPRGLRHVRQSEG